MCSVPSPGQRQSGAETIIMANLISGAGGGLWQGRGDDRHYDRCSRPTALRAAEAGVNTFRNLTTTEIIQGRHLDNSCFALPCVETIISKQYILSIYLPIFQIFTLFACAFNN